MAGARMLWDLTAVIDDDGKITAFDIVKNGKCPYEEHVDQTTPHYNDDGTLSHMEF
jgi:hypothetical protein